MYISVRMTAMFVSRITGYRIIEMLPFIFPIILFLLPGVASAQKDGKFKTVLTPQGRIKGLEVQLSGMFENGSVYHYRNIPYAIPPVGEYRFRKPVPHSPWNDTLDATEYGSICMQEVDPLSRAFFPNIHVSENCLYLNIYVPTDIQTPTKRSVMVWIHGGGFASGGGLLYDGSYLAVTGDIVVVTINYRLGIFGFFTTGTSTARGNYGLWDQILALQWVNQNIASFGGDPNSVTVFGQSAGGLSVSLLSVIPSNKGLFQRVIAQSGALGSTFSMSPVANKTSRAIGAEVACNESLEDQAFLKCLRSKTASSLINATRIANAQRSEMDGIHFVLRMGPVIDHELFHEDPSEILLGNSSEALTFFKSLDIIVGNCNQEGSLVLLTITPRMQSHFNFNISAGIPRKVFQDHIIGPLANDYLDSNQKVADAICTEYCIENNITEQSGLVLDWYADYFFIAPTVFMLDSHASNNTVSKQFQYIFSLREIFPIGPRTKWYRGAGHGADIFYLFGVEEMLQNRTLTIEDHYVAGQMLKYWTNFAKTGDPNTGHSVPTWPEYTESFKFYQDINGNVTTRSKYHEREMDFWLKEVPEILATGSELSSTPPTTIPATSTGASSATGVSHSSNQPTSTQINSNGSSSPIRTNMCVHDLIISAILLRGFLFMFS